jgi:cell wall assembly regulator SMI1
LWSLTSGQSEDLLGVIAGLQLLGPDDSESARASWSSLMTSGVGIDAVAKPDWDQSRSRDPDSVRAAYWAAGWIPLLRQPLEGDYLAVDLVPLSKGRPGQVIVCGRDRDTKSVVAPDIAILFQLLAQDCRSDNWQLLTNERHQRYMTRKGGLLLSACEAGRFPPKRAVGEP